MLVQIDSREKDRIQSASEYYKQQGLEVEVCELEVGDYIFDHKVCFEMKLIPDFIASIQEGRVFNQAITMAENYDWSFVMIHGDLYQRTKAIIQSRDYIPMTIEQYIGSISSLNRYTTVLQVYNSVIEEAYYTMMKQAEKCLSNRPIVKKFPKKHKNPAFNYLCYCIYGISSKKAQAIVDTYHLETLTDLMNLTIEDLTIIDGIGEKTAENIINSIQ